MTLVPDAIARESREPESDGGGEVRPKAVCKIAKERAQADEDYFVSRMHASVARAGASADSIAKLVHYELAGRYGVAALRALAARGLVRDC